MRDFSREKRGEKEKKKESEKEKAGGEIERESCGPTTRSEARQKKGRRILVSLCELRPS